MSYLDRVRRVKVGENHLVLYTEAPVKLTPIPATGYWIDLNQVTVRELAEAAGLPGSYDYALPQDFFNDFLKRHGERPVGVWWYPPKEDARDGKYWLGGRFVSVQEMLERIGQQLVE